MGKKYNVCVITFGILDQIGAKILRKFISILEPLSNELIIITGDFPIYNNIILINQFAYINIDNFFIRALNYIIIQLKSAYYLFRMRSKIDIVIFHIGAGTYIVPAILCKLAKRKLIIVETGSASNFEKNDNRFFGLAKSFIPSILRFIEFINFCIADVIAVEAKNVVPFAGLTKFNKKIKIGSMYIDHNFYKPVDKNFDTEQFIGFIGHLTQSKGIMSFIDAIPLILSEFPDSRFLIGTIGPLLNDVISELNSKGLMDRVILTGWIPDEEFPNYLNKLKLLVLPSSSEGLPNIVLESMACGVPVLATSVGGIPDLIHDEITGFILENNSSECIAKNVIRALRYPFLERISINARSAIERNYVYSSAIERYISILSME